MRHYSRLASACFIGGLSNKLRKAEMINAPPKIAKESP
jgi:hypothetical protein